MNGEPASGQGLADLIRDAFEEGANTIEGPEGIEQMARFLEGIAVPDFATVMVPKDGPALEFRGVDGFREALSDWISPYERFRLRIEEVIVRPERVAFRASQVATTKHGGVEIETPGVSVWSILDGRVTQAAFYLDEEAGLRAAGIVADS